MKKYIYIGGHVGASGGLHTAIAQAENIGANCMQIFGASPRQWVASLPSEEVVSKYRDTLKKSSVTGPVFLHASYLVNLGSPEVQNRTKSIKNLIIHLKIAEMLGAQGLIFHIGSSKGEDKTRAMNYVIEGMQEVIKQVPGSAQLIMENSAGGGAKLGVDLDEIAYMHGRAKNKRIKVCIDTAHSFEAGLIPDYSSVGVKKFCIEFDSKIGLEHLVALHINDSKTECGSHHDRHENLGEGYIGLAAFKNLASEKLLSGIPWILEVPGFDNEGPDKKNIDRAKKCFKN